MQRYPLAQCAATCVLSVSLLSLALTLTLAAPAQAAPASPAPAGPGVNLLTNPSHELPGVNAAGSGGVNVTWNWIPFWQAAPLQGDPNDPLYRTPDFHPALASLYRRRVHSGAASDSWSTLYARNPSAGIMQVVSDLPVGKPVRFTSWLSLWSSNDSRRTRSSHDGNLKVRVCVQQDGGIRSAPNANLKCSDWQQPYDTWKQLTVDAVPMTTTVLAIIESTADLPVRHNEAYADDSCFEVLGRPGARSVCQGAYFVPTGAVEAPGGAEPQAAVNASFLVIRPRPLTTAKSLGTVSYGVTLDVTGRSAGGRWFQVRYKGGLGWVLVSLTVPNDAAKAAPIVTQ